jgi:predicted N-acetyltransferase YhbS
VLDNLHVRHGLKGQGLGRRLVVATAEAVVSHDPESGLYVEVLEQNTAAHAFYERLGARCVHQGTFAPPGGGLTHERRYAWPTPATLLQ